MRLETNKLKGNLLDWAIAEADDRTSELSQVFFKKAKLMNLRHGGVYSPSTHWSQGGPIIDREIHTLIKRDGIWEAECFFPKLPSENRFCYSAKGDTALVAAMRAFVISRLGASVDVPDKLIGACTL